MRPSSKLFIIPVVLYLLLYAACGEHVTPNQNTDYTVVCDTDEYDNSNPLEVHAMITSVNNPKQALFSVAAAGNDKIVLVDYMDTDRLHVYDTDGEYLFTMDISDRLNGGGINFVLIQENSVIIGFNRNDSVVRMDFDGSVLETGTLCHSNRAVVQSAERSALAHGGYALKASDGTSYTAKAVQFMPSINYKLIKQDATGETKVIYNAWWGYIKIYLSILVFVIAAPILFQIVVYIRKNDINNQYTNQNNDNIFGL